MFQKDIFWKSAVATIIVFILGISVGIWLDSYRVDETRNELTKIDTSWNDARIEGIIFKTLSPSGDFCDKAIDSNFKFYESILEEGYKIDDREEVNKLDPNLIEQKKRYVLLQMQYWLNAIELRNKCNRNYTTILYFYSHFDKSLEIDQDVQSTVLMEYIYACGQNLVVIPIPSDLDLISINLIKDRFSIENVPALLINEETLLEGPVSKEELGSYLNC